MHAVRTTVVLVALVSGVATNVAADILPAPERISEHVYAWIGPYPAPSKENRGYRMNLAFVVGDKSVAVLDTGYTEEMAREMLAHIAKITPLPVKYAVNSNSQPHRFMGNGVFRAAGASIIAHRGEVERMNRDGGAMAQGVERSLELRAGSIKVPPPPDRVIDGDLEIDLGGLRLNILHIGKAHTPAQLVTHIPRDNVVYAGDVLYRGRLLAVLQESNVKAWIASYDKLAKFSDAVFIPGHGRPGKLSEFAFSTREYLAMLYQHMQKMVDDGVDLQDAMKRLDQSRYRDLANFDELAGRNASWAYLEREAESFK